MQYEEYIDDHDQLSDDPEYTGPAFYVIDSNGIVAGPFDEIGEAQWWSDKAKRVA